MNYDTVTVLWIRVTLKMNYELNFHDVVSEKNFNHPTLKSYQMATENFQILQKNKQTESTRQF